MALGLAGAAATGCGATTDPSTSAGCCHGLGACVPSALVPANAAAEFGQDQCASGLLCVPGQLLQSSTAHFGSCRSFDDAPGRCVPSCLPEIAGGPALPVAGCTSGYECAPCFDPFDGGPTGVCSIGNDEPDSGPVLFPTCCAGLGRCIPTESVPQSEQSELGADTCSSGSLCVPSSLAVDPGAGVPHCYVSATGAEGRCLPGCVPEVGSRKAELSQSTCPASNLCTPCFDPVTGASTGACTIGGDTPSQPPVVFPSCCDDGGSCVPGSLVSASMAADLSSAGCSGPGQVCVPTAFAQNPALVPPSCTVTTTAAEGRCLTTCLPLVASRAGSLAQGACAGGELCVPCDDPVSGASTGACTINGDQPTLPSYEFASCCSGEGRCVPESLVPADDQSHLAADTCAVAQLCVPADFAENTSFVPQACTVASLGAEGRCLPACLPDVAPYANTLAADGCRPPHLCVPCYDPVDGTATGACSINGDAPTEPAVEFASCCSGAGRCVPASLVPASNASHFGPDICQADTGDLCVPSAFVNDPKTVPAPCTVSANGSIGSCLPACLPQVQSERAYLQQDGCPPEYLCAPCTNPVSGASTGACSLGGDGGSSADGGVETCCRGLGTCLPASWVATSGATPGDVAALGQGSCTASTDLCVPSAIAADPTHYVAPTCTLSSTGSEGRCLPACLSGLCSAELKQDGCDGAYVCVPCFDPVTGASTGACHIGGDPGPAAVPAAPAQCCSGLGTCVPSGLVTTKDQSELGTGTCDAGAICAPTAYVDAVETCQKYVFPSCTVAVTGAEGRCLPSCLPSVAQNASGLTQSTCAALNMCAPCYDPVTGEATGACTIGSDEPKNPPVVFPQCCRGLGRCVPSAYVASSLAPDLGTSGCTTGALCAPAELIDPPGTRPPSCTTSLNQAEGRCLPSCLPAVQAVAGEVAQDGCATGMSCVPCYDPVSSKSTGACTTGTDGPVQPSKGLDSCCSGTGLCAPAAAVPASLESQVVTDTCTAEQPVSCVPAAAATDPTGFLLQHCTDSATGAEGRCLPSCLQSVSAEADRLRQSGCPTAELCVPCYDPVTGGATGACTTAPGDQPTQPPVVFSQCCTESGTALGLCVPAALVPSSDPTPPQLTCASGQVCAPRTVVLDPSTPPSACSAALGAKGECVLACLVSSLLQPYVSQASCDSDSECVACALLGGTCP